MAHDRSASGTRCDEFLHVLKAAESLWEASRVFLAQWNLGPSQFNALNLLRHKHEGMMQTDLSRELLTHRSNVTGLIDRLEKRDLVRRTSKPGDRRARVVVLTKAGTQLVEQILPRYHEAIEAIWDETSLRKSASLAKNLENLARRAGDIARDRSARNQ
jgi:MarR family 2-MHQ and catechol resistance regulon transcriptional repressor